MKTGNAALIIAAGILLLWVVTSNRTQNLSASWQALLGTAPKTATSAIGTATSSATSAAQPFTVGDQLPSLSSTSLGAQGLPTIYQLTGNNADGAAALSDPTGGFYE